MAAAGAANVVAFVLKTAGKHIAIALIIVDNEDTPLRRRTRYGSGPRIRSRFAKKTVGRRGGGLRTIGGGLVGRGRSLEKFIDKAEQLLARFVNFLQVGGKLFEAAVARLLEQHLAVPDDVVQRRPQGMAHIGGRKVFVLLVLACRRLFLGRGLVAHDGVALARIVSILPTKRLKAHGL